MKNNYLIIPGENIVKKSPNVDFLFPLKGFCVGFKKEYELKEIPENAFIYINRVLDTEGILQFKELLPNLTKIKGIVFEDLGVLELLIEENTSFLRILYATHANCSVDTINTYLDFVDSVVISPDITKEEIEVILEHAKKKVCLTTYGPIPYMYSRRTLLKNYQDHFDLKEQKELSLEETGTKKKFVFFENPYGTVCFDEKKFDGRFFLNHENVFYHLINLDWDTIEDFDFWLEEFENKKELSQTFDGFLNQKTIYRLPPRKDNV